MEDDYLFKNAAIRKRLEHIIDTIGQEMFPAGGEIPYSAKDVGLTDYMMEFLGRLAPKQSNMVCVLLLTYEYVLPPLYLRGLKFSDLESEDKIFLLEELHDSSIYPLRMLNVGLRMFFTFGYMADERVLKEMGYFKQYDYPNDSRLIEVLKSLPWEKEEVKA